MGEDLPTNIGVIHPPPHPHAGCPIGSTYLGNLSNHYPAGAPMPDAAVVRPSPKLGKLRHGRVNQPVGLCPVGGRMEVGTHHAHFIVLGVQVMQQDVPQGNYADQLFARAYRQVAKAVPPHEG